MWTWFADPWQRWIEHATRHFRAVPVGPLVLRYDPAIDPFEAALFRTACRQQVAALEELFGARLRPWWAWPRRLRVYAFRSPADLSQACGAPVHGFADPRCRYIVVNLHDDWREILRHELAHIFGGRWNANAPRFLCEGLAVWAQRTLRGHPIDDCARRMMPRRDDPMEFLLGPEPSFGSTEHSLYYLLAGSFTAALVRRFGLRRFRELYRDRAITATTFAQRFERHFAVSLRSAVDRWRADLAGRRQYGGFALYAR